MSNLPKLNKLRSAILSTIAVSAITINPSLLQAQALEEIVVTAQRRVQSLQEVPISIDTFSGIELTKQGFRTMEDMGQFSPSVEMNESLHEQSVTIRGQGDAERKLGPGDLLVLPQGWRGEWILHEKTRKLYVIHKS